jgi:hypothetical protein
MAQSSCPGLPVGRRPRPRREAEPIAALPGFHSTVFRTGVRGRRAEQPLRRHPEHYEIFPLPAERGAEQKPGTITHAPVMETASSACLGRLRRLAVQDWLLREPNPDSRWDRQIGPSCPIRDVNGTEFWQHAARLGRGAALAAQAHVTSRSGTRIAPERGSATDASGVISETGLSAAI